jgi:excisionase family DNA binding protein
MPRTKQKTPPRTVNGPPDEVLTLAEAAAYMRLPEADVLRLVTEQALPARRLGNEWRFLKEAIRQWLSTPPSKGSKEGIWSIVGSWKDDPYLDEMLKEIYRKRGRKEYPASGGKKRATNQKET